MDNGDGGPLWPGSETQAADVAERLSRASARVVRPVNIKIEPPKPQGWIGVDLDGTLAEHRSGHGIEDVGAPIPLMVERVLAWMNSGREVRIVTARVSPDRPLQEQADQRAMVEAWCREHLGTTLIVQAHKDPGMRQLWDDRAIQVERNTGLRVVEDEEPGDDTPTPAEVEWHPPGSQPHVETVEERVIEAWRPDLKETLRSARRGFGALLRFSAQLGEAIAEVFEPAPPPVVEIEKDGWGAPRTPLEVSAASRAAADHEIANRIGGGRSTHPIVIEIKVKDGAIRCRCVVCGAEMSGG